MPLTASQAMAELDRLEAAGLKLLGIDGLRMAEDGSYVAPIDLIFDATAAEARPQPPATIYRSARAFIEKNRSAHIMWEIVWEETR